MNTRPLYARRHLLAAIVTGIACVTTGRTPAAEPVAGQPAQGVELQRRLDELNRIQLENRIRANTDVPLNQRAMIDFGGYITLQYYSITDRAGDNHGLRQPDLYLYGRINLDSASEVFARLRTSYKDYNRGDGFHDRNTEYISPDLERGYYRFDLAAYQGAYYGKQPAYNVTAQFGRDLVYWGNGLAVGEVIDGGMFDVNWQQLSLSLVAGVTPVRTADFDTSRPHSDTSTRRGFYGGLLTWNPPSASGATHHPYIYGMIQQDYNHYDSLDEGGIQTRFEYNSYYLGFGSTGSLNDHLLYGVEAVYEGGSTLSNSYVDTATSRTQVEQSHNPISALAMDARLDYVVNDRRNTRFSAEILAASGDRNRGGSATTVNGSKPNSHDHAFNGFGLINTGLAFAPDASSLGFVRLGASTYPLVDVEAFRRLQVGMDLFVYSKLQKGDAITESSGRHYYLGTEPDFYMNWQIAPDVTFTARYGVFFPAHETLTAHSNPRQFLYTGLTFAF